MSVAVVGYASLDYCVRLDSPPRADRTATILSRAVEWPRLGGSPAYVAAALAVGGVRDAAPVSWVGDDSDGALYRDRLVRLGVRVDGVSVRPGRTPLCILAYQPDGGCCCLYDPASDAPDRLDEAQRALLAGAKAICITVGPTEATREALRLARPDAMLIWAVKADPRAVPPDLAAALAKRADIVAFSKGEAGFVAEAFAAGKPEPRRIGIETRGRDGVAFTRNGATKVFPVAQVEADDSTGAGDTFIGGFLAAWLKKADPEQAVKAGADAARALLAARPVAGARG